MARDEVRRLFAAAEYADAGRGRRAVRADGNRIVKRSPRFQAVHLDFFVIVHPFLLLNIDSRVRFPIH